MSEEATNVFVEVDHCETVEQRIEGVCYRKTAK
jgi:hypothetical protein